MANNNNSTTESCPHSSHTKEVEHSFEHNMEMYDTLPYTRDSDLCTPDYISHTNNRVIRYYKYDTEKRSVGKATM